MKKVVFVDSSIITMLLSVEKMLSEKGGVLVVLYPNKQATDLFSVTSIDKIMKIFTDENELQHL
jgi:anti-anti-sigma factor